MKEVCKRLKDHYVHFVEKQSFPLIVTVCVAVIVATALFTKKDTSAYVSPTPPVLDPITAAQLLQQSLGGVSTFTPAPTKAPTLWCSPLETTDVLRAYDTDKMVRTDSGIWAVHDAVDLKASPGSKVLAIGNGEVIAQGSDDLQGAWLTIRHDQGITAHYAGLVLLNDYLPGDTVRKGDTIGFSGSGMLDEASLEPHLHLRVTKDGIPIDPCTLWEASSNRQTP